MLQPHERGQGGGFGHVWRFDATTGAKLTGFGWDNEGFGMMTITAQNEVCVTTNILGTNFLYRFNGAGTYLGTVTAADYAGWSGATRGPDGNFYALMSTLVSSTSFDFRHSVVRLARPSPTVVVDHGAGGMTAPFWMVFGPDRNLYIADRQLGILRFNGTNGAFIDNVVPLGRGGLQDITRMIFGPDGRLYVASSADDSVRRFDAASGALIDRFVTPASGGLVNPRGLAFGPDGNLYVSSFDTRQVLRYDGRTGAYLSVAATDPGLEGPTDIVFMPPAGAEIVWFDDALPAGAQPNITGGDGWNWVTPGAYSGTAAHRTTPAGGLQGHSFTGATDPMTVGVGDTLFVYVAIDGNTGPNAEIMLSWHDGTSWEHRAYWGVNAINYGQDGTAGRRYMGTLPRASGWMRLEVPASLVALEGKTVRGMSFSHYNTGATWDRAGKTTPSTTGSPADTTPPTVALTAPANGGTVTGTITLNATASDNMSVPRVAFYVDGDIFAGSAANAPYSRTWNTLSVSNGPHSLTAIAIDAAGNTTKSPAVTVTVNNPPPPSPDVVWLDDALPAGAQPGASGGDGWNWVSANPAPHTGTLAHQSNLAAGVHGHSFNFARAPLQLAAGDYLYAWVYLDPTNPPQEIMLSWCDGSSWEHRAFWGANLINYGQDGTAGRFRAAWSVPPAGQWTRLLIPAHWVGLEGKTITGMAFILHGGRATWDSAGKTNNGNDVTPPVVRILSPANGATVSGTVDFSIEARDDGGFGIVSYAIDGTHGGSLAGNSNAYRFAWDTTHVSNGTHTFTVTARDNAGNETATNISVMVNNPTTGDTAAPVVTILEPANNAVVSGMPYLRARATDDTAVARLEFKIGGTLVASRSGSGTPALDHQQQWNSGSVANGSHLFTAIATDTAGNQKTASVMFSVNNMDGSGAVIWIDGAVPAGAWTSVNGGDSWNWVTSNPAPFSATRLHQSNIAAGLHGHSFNGASTPLQIFAGDVLFAYVYLDPANVPEEIMLSWHDGNWEHRAYWGANRITYGTDGTNGRRYIGALPPAGQWVRLDVPAALVGLEQRSVNGMSFTLYGGRATWDLAGKVRP